MLGPETKIRPTSRSPSAFPSDLVTGMAALLSGFSGSTYLATANQYVGGTATTTYAGSLSETSAPPKSAPSTSQRPTPQAQRARSV